MKTRKQLSKYLLFLLACSGSYAQNFSDEEPGLIGSYADETEAGTGQAQSVGDAPAVATVISAKDIKRMGATNLDQVLESVPGLHVSLSSNNLSPVYSIRGIQTDKNPQVLMLMNGVPMTELFLGDRGARSTLPINSIERVEVLRGPGSTVYGADAFAGVINVITKTGKNINGIEIGASAGSFNSQQGWVLMGAQRAGWDFYFSIEASSTDGDDDREVHIDSQTAFDSALAGLGIPAASTAPDQLHTDKDRVDIHLQAANENWTLRAWNWSQKGGNGPGIASALDSSGEGKANNYMLDTSYQYESKFYKNKLRLSYTEHNGKIKSTLFPNDTALPIGTDGNLDINNPIALVGFPDGFIGNPEVEEKHYRLDFSSFYSGFDKHLFRVAAGSSYEELNAKEKKNFGPGVLDENSITLPPIGASIDGTLTNVTNTANIFIPDKDRTIYYASLQDQWNFSPDWTLTLGVRHDDYSDFGSTTNPRAALVWKTGQNLTTKLLYGRAFRAPSFAELFTVNNPIVEGNRSLDPEVINTYELVFGYENHDNLHATVNIFYYEIDDLIEFATEPGQTSSMAQNIGEQEGRGLELEGGWNITDTFAISGNYAYQTTEDKHGDPTPNAPENQVYLEAVWQFKTDWFASTQGSWIGDRKRSRNDNRDDIDDYTLLNLTAGCQCFSRLNMSISVKNIFDKNNYEPSPYEVQPAYPGDYPLEGRSFIFSAIYTFKL